MPQKREEQDLSKEVRFPVVITAGERWRLRAVAAVLRQPVEDVAGEWLRERLAVQEKQLGIPADSPAPAAKRAKS